jgi:PAS domain S-box-containing protein
MLIASLDALPFAAVLLDDDGGVLATNHRFDVLTGRTLSDLRDRPFEEALCPDTDTDAHTVQRVRHALASRQLFAGELLCHRSNGAPFWNDLILLPVQHASVTGARMVALFRDVTARRTAEHALGTSAAQDRLLLDLIQAGIVVHTASGQLTYANAKATELLGVTYDTALGALITDPRWRFIREDGSVLPIEEYPVSRAVATRALVRNIVVGLTRDSDQKLVWLMGNAYPVLDEAGNVSEIVISFTEVTNLKQAERALQKSEERLQLVLQGAKDAAWDWDVATDEAYYSPRYWEMLGYAVDELPADPWMWLRQIHPDDQPRVLGQIDGMMQGGATTYEIEFRMRHKSGQFLSILSRGFVLRDAAGAAPVWYEQRPHGEARGRGASAAVAEDGGDRPVGRWRGARFQQLAGGDRRQSRIGAARRCGIGGGARPRDQGRECGTARCGSHTPAALLFASTAVAAGGNRCPPGDHRPEPGAAARHRRDHPRGGANRAGAAPYPDRRRFVRQRVAQSGDQCT